MSSSFFDEETIQKLFGHEAAEDENPARLKEYYFKSKTYTQVANKTPLRLVVGHKGIGKSALFKVAQAEESESNILTVAIQPNDLRGIATQNLPFLDLISEWESGLLEVIARKILGSFNIPSDDIRSLLIQRSGKIIEFLSQTFREKLEIDQKPAHEAIISQYLEKREIAVYIDDLDRGWEGKSEDIRRISALLNAVRDITNSNPGVRFRIALRSDVYFLVRTSDESTDKIEGSVVWQSYTNHEILCLLVKRIESFFGRTVDENHLTELKLKTLADYLTSVVEPTFNGQGHWKDAPMHMVFMSLIRKRPRDLVKLLTLAARHASQVGNSRLSTGDFESVFAEYSQGRVQDTINEFRSELPDIQRLIMNMKPNKQERVARLGYVYETASLITKIGSIEQSGIFVFSNGRRATPKDLIQFMYKINFLTGRKETPDGIIRKYFEENQYIYTTFADFGFAWEVHPAYRWALQPDSPLRIFQELELSSD